MQSQFARYYVAGLLAVALTGVALVGESSAQWGRFATPYYVNYNADFYPAYPGYVAWRPFGGLFAGIHSGLHGLLCPGCWHSPCCCVTPVICDPCFDPCIDPCCDPCCGYAGGFGYSGYYELPKSLTLGMPSSPTGFGSITPAEGTPGQRPVGVPSVQRPAVPSSVRTLTTSPGTIGSPMSGVPNYSNNNGQPNLAPPRNQGRLSDPASKIENQLNEMPRSTPFEPSVGSSIRSDAANIPPSTSSDEEWYKRNSPDDSNPPGTGTVPNDGTMPAPSGPGTTTVPDTQGIGLPSVPGSSTHNMIELGTGTISVTVPDNAKVYINGYETKMPGVNRRYVVNGLAPGQYYDYEVRIVALVNGQTVEETQYVTLSSGQQGMVAFGKPQSQPDNTRYVAARPTH